MDEDYEIISRSEINNLKKEIKELKEGKGSASAKNIMNSLNQMLELFKQASSDIKEEAPLSEKLDSISEKLEKILDQNQKVAEGVLAVADLIKGEEHKVKEHVLNSSNASIGTFPNSSVGEPQNQPQLNNLNEVKGIKVPEPMNVNSQMNPAPGFQQRPLSHEDVRKQFPKQPLPPLNPLGSSDKLIPLPSRPSRRHFLGKQQ